MRHRIHDGPAPTSDPTPPAVSEAMREAVIVAIWHVLRANKTAEQSADDLMSAGPIASEIARLTAHAECGHANADENYRRLQAAEAETARLRAALEGAEARGRRQGLEEATKPKVWVVTNNERGADRRYRMWSGRAWVWTSDPDQAAWFARMADANQILPDGSPYDYTDRIAILTEMSRADV